MIENTQPLVDAINSNDLKAAQVAYGKARPYYERIEPVAESFTSGKDNLDSDIDARADDVPAAAVDRLPPHREGPVPGQVHGWAADRTRRGCWRT